MKRRDFITLLGGTAVAWPLGARAQQRVRRIGVLVPYAENDAETLGHLGAFRERLQQHGWTEGRNVLIDYRWTGGDATRLRPLAKELVALQPDVLMGRATPVAAAFLAETRSIPIVFVNVADPVGQGLVASLARPDGNVTGFTTVETILGSKWLGLLRELVPGIERVAVLFNPDTAGGAGGYVRFVEDAAASIAVKVTVAPIQNASEIERAIDAFASKPNGVLVVLPDITTTIHRQQIIGLAERNRLPAMYPYRFFARDGGLMSYGVDLADLFRKAAGYVDRILRGAKPSDLPVQQPTKFELSINLKTAKALGLNVPPSLLARTDEVIE
jgi:putative tryptophan/tyrosine transport system substrate-binding protein